MELPSENEIIKSICEDSFYEFLKFSWPELEPTTELINNWHIEYLCNLFQKEMERIAENKPNTKDIIINIPPRTLKSTIVSVMLNAWAWAKYPHLKFIGCSFSGNLAVEHAVKSRRLIEGEFYRNKWGIDFKMTTDQNVKSFFENSKTGFRKGVGTGGTLTGSGCDVLVVDDILNPEESYSEVEREKANRWYKETAYNRLNNPEVGLRIIIMQRLHEEDLTGWCLKYQPDKYNFICLPATSEGNISPSELSKNYEDGFLFKKRLNKNVLDDFKQTLGSFGYSGQYLQNPMPAGGGIFKREWFKYYKQMPEVKRSVWVWDTAVKKGEENDFSAGILICEGVDNNFYVPKIRRERVEYPELKRLIPQEFNADKSNYVLIEDKSSGQQLIQELKTSLPLPIIPVEVVKDKVTRANLVSPLVEAGFVYLPEGASWISDFIFELCNFPKAKHDDQVDAFCHGLNYLKNKQENKVSVTWI